MICPGCKLFLQEETCLSKSHMSNEPEIPAICPYCGRPNKEAVNYCIGCSTPLSSVEPAKPPKSKVLAVLLAFFFGPLGLLYSSLLGAMVMLLVAIAIAMIFPGVVWVRGFFVVCCAIWAARAVDLKNGQATFDDDAEILLNQAAAMERKDRVQAIALYEEIIQLHPGTDAAQEAKNNIATLTADKK
jgi:hypothetical protein